MASYDVAYERTDRLADARWAYTIHEDGRAIITGYARTRRAAEQAAREDIADHIFETNHTTGKSR
jgi:hypothetical protein